MRTVDDRHYEGQIGVRSEGSEQGRKSGGVWGMVKGLLPSAVDIATDLIPFGSTVKKWAPYALDIAPSVYRAFAGDTPEQKLRSEVLQDQIEETNRLARIGRGEFTTAEARGLTSGVRAAVGESLAARGLERSPMAANVYSRAAAEQLRKTQLSATQIGAESRGSLLRMLPPTDPIFDDLVAMKDAIAKRRLLDKGGRSEEQQKGYDALDASIKETFLQLLATIDHLSGVLGERGAPVPLTDEGPRTPTGGGGADLSNTASDRYTDPLRPWDLSYGA